MNQDITPVAQSIAALTPEQAFTYLSVHFRTIDQHTNRFKALLPRMDWQKLYAIGLRNNLFAHFYRVLKHAELQPLAPADFVAYCRDRYFFFDFKINAYRQEMAAVLPLLHAQDLPYVTSRGYHFCYHLYDNLPVKVFNDIDLFTTPEVVDDIIVRLEPLGYRLRGNSLSLDYYKKYHLHVQLQNQKNSVLIELHWAPDHKYTLYQVPVSFILEHSRTCSMGTFDARVPDRELELLLTLLHSIKHAPLIKYAHTQAERMQLFFSGIEAMKFLDCHYYIRHQYDKINWQRLAELSRQFFCADHLRVGLEYIQQVLHTPVPQDFTAALPPYKPRPAESWLPRLLLRLQNQDVNRVKRHWRWVHALFSRHHDALVFNHIRIIDLFRFFNPPKAYLGHLKTRHNLPYWRRNRLYLFFHGLWQVWLNVYSAAKELLCRKRHDSATHSA